MLDITELAKGLGFYFNVLGNGTSNHLSNMWEKGMTWIDKLGTEPFPTRDAYTSFFLQLFPGMTFGLAMVNMTRKKMEAMMRSLYFKLLPLPGVNRHITKECMMLGE